jgi:hypothetical protein
MVVRLKKEWLNMNLAILFFNEFGVFLKIR